MKSYRVRVGINYVPAGGKKEIRREPGDLVSDLPAAVAATWLEQGVIDESASEPDEASAPAPIKKGRG